MPTKRKGETSYKQTAFGIIPRFKLIPLEIEGIKKAWDFVLQKDKIGNIPITPNFLQTLHKIGFGWIFPDAGGKFRKIEVTVSNHKPPRAHQVPYLMVDFCEDVKARIKHLPKLDDNNFINALIDLLAWAHHKFLWIHPFQDYNGRIGRLLINIILLNLKLPPIELRVETKFGRKNYIKALQDADHGNYSKLQALIDAALKESAEEFSK